jgi:hypothetical protein
MMHGQKNIKLGFCYVTVFHFACWYFILNSFYTAKSMKNVHDCLNVRQPNSHYCNVGARWQAEFLHITLSYLY